MIDVTPIVLITWLAGWVFSVAPMVLGPKLRDPKLALYWIAIGGSAFACGGLTYASNMMRDDPFNAFIYDQLLLPFSIMFLWSLLYGSYMMGKAGDRIGPWWMRLIVFVSMLYVIPMGFGGVAEVIDGSRGSYSIIQYNSEFYWRLLDMITGTALSNFHGSGYDDMVVLTKTNSLSAFLFNILIGTLVLSWLGPLLAPHFRQPPRSIAG